MGAATNSGSRQTRTAIDLVEALDEIGNEVLVALNADSALSDLSRQRANAEKDLEPEVAVEEQEDLERQARVVRPQLSDMHESVDEMESVPGSGIRKLDVGSRRRARGGIGSSGEHGASRSSVRCSRPGLG